MVIPLDNGQNQEWRLSLADAKFSFGVESESAPFHELTEGVLVSILLAEPPTGPKFIFGELLPEEEQ
jgi:hypothetical protein